MEVLALADSLIHENRRHPHWMSVCIKHTGGDAHTSILLLFALLKNAPLKISHSPSAGYVSYNTANVEVEIVTENIPNGEDTYIYAILKRVG